jgi:acetyltransferase-like isoleucine patch superfamily enzyme
LPISERAVVETDDIGDDVRISDFAVIREGVTLGHGVIVHPFVVIEPGVRIGDNVEIFPGTYIGKVPKGAGVLSRTPVFEPRVEISHDCSIGPNAVIFYDVEIGSSSLVGDGASIREGSRVGSRSIVGRYVTINYNTLIGDRVRIQDHTWLAGNMTIEDDVFISGLVGTANDNALGRSGYEEASIVGPYICKGAAIGVGANLLPNIRIGRGAIVGSGAVATKDVPDNAIVLGVPARVTRYIEPEQDR